MSNIVDALKAKFGGKGQSIAEVVKTMEGSGSGGGGSDDRILIVKFTGTGSNTYVCDTSKTDIWEALRAGKIVLGNVMIEQGGSPVGVNIVSVNYATGVSRFVFAGMSTAYYCTSDEYTYKSNS